MNRFFRYGLPSGRRFSTPARGNDRRNDAISLTEHHELIGNEAVGRPSLSSSEAPVMPAAYSKAVLISRGSSNAVILRYSRMLTYGSIVFPYTARDDDDIRESLREQL